MLRFRKYFLFAIIPLLAVVTAFILNHARGPYWLAGNLDPDYVYLLNASNMAQFKQVGHIDHPGTTVQLLGAIVIQVIHLFHNPGNLDLPGDVINRPEYYLHAIQLFITLSNALLLFFLGCFTYKYTGKLILSLWLQSAPFFSFTLLLSGFTRLTPEPLLFSAGLWLIILLVKYIPFTNFSTPPEIIQEANERNKTTDLDFKAITWLSLTSGFGMAGKITFAPLLIIPLIIIKKWKKKLFYLAGSITSFILFTLPIMGMYDEFFRWIYNLLVHKQRYGTGEIGMISLAEYLENIKKLLLAHPLFTGGLVFACLAIIFGSLFRKSRTHSFSNPAFKLLLALVLAQLFGVFMAAKHPAGHYLAPTLLLNGISLATLYFFLKHLWSLTPWPPKIFLLTFASLVAVSIILLNPITTIYQGVKNLETIQRESLKIFNESKIHYTNYGKIYYYASSSPQYALKFGNDLSRNTHAAMIDTKYPDSYFYDDLRKKFYRFDYRFPVSVAALFTRHSAHLVIQGPRRKTLGPLLLEKLKMNRFGEGIFKPVLPSRPIMDKTIRWLGENIELGQIIVFPDTWGGITRGLQPRYQVYLCNYVKLSPLEWHGLVLALDNPYFVVTSEIREKMRENGLQPGVMEYIDNETWLARGERNAGAKMEISVWSHSKKNPRRAARGLHVIRRAGEFSLNFSRQADKNLLEIAFRGENKDGKAFCQVGFMAGKKGFKMDLPGSGAYVFFVIRLDSPAALISGSNHLFIEDYNQRWQTVREMFPRAGSFVCVAWKKIRPGAQCLRFGLQFSPDSPGDHITIKDIKVFKVK